MAARSREFPLIWSPAILTMRPRRLIENEDKAFQGSILLGMGFTFDDDAAAKGEAEPISVMERLIAKTRGMPSGLNLTSAVRKSITRRRMRTTGTQSTLRICRCVGSCRDTSLASADETKLRERNFVQGLYRQIILARLRRIGQIFSKSSINAFNLREQNKPERSRRDWWRYAEDDPDFSTRYQMRLDRIVGRLPQFAALELFAAQIGAVYSHESLIVFALPNFSSLRRPSIPRP